MTEELYLIMMLAKDGRIIAKTTSQLDNAEYLGELMLSSRQALACDIFQLEPQRKYLPKTK